MEELNLNEQQIKAGGRVMRFKKELIMTTGPYSHKWIQEEDVKTVEVENWVIEDGSGLP